jgi:hypothetical protein
MAERNGSPSVLSRGVDWRPVNLVFHRGAIYSGRFRLPASTSIFHSTLAGYHVKNCNLFIRTFGFSKRRYSRLAGVASL